MDMFTPGTKMHSLPIHLDVFCAFVYVLVSCRDQFEYCININAILIVILKYCMFENRIMGLEEGAH